MNHKTFQWKW